MRAGNQRILAQRDARPAVAAEIGHDGAGGVVVAGVAADSGGAGGRDLVFLARHVGGAGCIGLLDRFVMSASTWWISALLVQGGAGCVGLLDRFAMPASTWWIFALRVHGRLSVESEDERNSGAAYLSGRIRR